MITSGQQDNRVRKAVSNYQPGLRQKLFPEGWFTAGRWLALFLLTAWAIFSLFPLYWGIITSLKAPKDVASIPPSLTITQPSLENYFRFVQGVGVANAPVIRWFFNSCLVTAATTIGALLFASLAGYSFARKRFWGRDLIFWSLIATMLIPQWSVIVPTYVLTYDLHMHDTYWVLILPGLASPFAVFLVRQFMVTLPEELFHAARVDGATEWQLWYHLALPLSRPVPWGARHLYFGRELESILVAVTCLKQEQHVYAPGGRLNDYLSTPGHRPQLRHFHGRCRVDVGCSGHWVSAHATTDD